MHFYFTDFYSPKIYVLEPYVSREYFPEFYVPVYWPNIRIRFLPEILTEITEIGRPVWKTYWPNSVISLNGDLDSSEPTVLFWVLRTPHDIFYFGVNGKSNKLCVLTIDLLSSLNYTYVLLFNIS